jgi:tRNA U54 and U55 pseudouridine synthase Pus10
MSTDRYVSEVQSGLNREINDVRKTSFELLKATEKELVDRFSDQYTEVKTYMTSNVEFMRDLTTNSATSLTASLKQIKQVCSNYFQHYELDLEELRLRTGTLENKYKDWSKVLIEPQTMNDARVFALEARMEGEEEARVKE